MGAYNKKECLAVIKMHFVCVYLEYLTVPHANQSANNSHKCNVLNNSECSIHARTSSGVGSIS